MLVLSMGQQPESPVFVNILLNEKAQVVQERTLENIDGIIPAYKRALADEEFSSVLNSDNILPGVMRSYTH